MLVSTQELLSVCVLLHQYGCTFMRLCSRECEKIFFGKCVRVYVRFCVYICASVCPTMCVYLCAITSDCVQKFG